jgi:hypothetical protein
MVLADIRVVLRIHVSVIRVTRAAHRIVAAGDRVAGTAIVQLVAHVLGRRTLLGSVVVQPVIVPRLGPKTALAPRLIVPLQTVLRLIALHLTGRVVVVLRLIVPVVVGLRLVIVRIVGPVLPMQSGPVLVIVRHRVPMGTVRSLLIAVRARPLVIVRRKPSVPVASVPPTVLIEIVLRLATAVKELRPRRPSHLVSPHGVRIVALVRTAWFVKTARFAKSVSCVRIVRRGSPQKLRVNALRRGFTARSQRGLRIVTVPTDKLPTVDQSLGNPALDVLSVLPLLAPVLVPKVVLRDGRIVVLRVAMSLGVLRTPGHPRQVDLIVLVAIVLEPVALTAPQDRLIVRDSLVARRLIVVLVQVGSIVIVVPRPVVAVSLAVPVVLVPQLLATPMPELIAVQTVALVLLVGMRRIPTTRALARDRGSAGGLSLVPVVKAAATVALALGFLVLQLQHLVATSGRAATVTVPPRQSALDPQSLHGAPVVLTSSFCRCSRSG